MDNPYQPPKADGIGGAIDKPRFFAAFRQASQQPAIACSFWERGRVLHGIVLLLVFASMMVVRPEAAVLFRERIGNFLGLVLFANFLYSAAYGFELVALLLPSRRVNPTVRYFMLIAGTLLAAILTVAAVELGLLDNNGDQ